MMFATTPVVQRLFLRAMQLWMTAALLGAVANAQAALSFQIEVATRNQPGQGASMAPDERHTSQVVLGERYMSVTSSGQSHIFDLASRRRYQIDLKAGTYVDYSLFDTVGMRVMEAGNRETLNRALVAAKIDTPVFDPVFNEQSLSVLALPARTMSEVIDGADTVLSVDGKVLLRMGAGGAAVDAGDAAAFIRYVRYQFGGHPLVLAQLAALRRIPHTFVLYYGAIGGVQMRTFTITGLTTAAPAAYALSAFSERAGGAGEIDQLLDRARQVTQAGLQERRLKFETEVAAAFAEQRPFDGLLGTIEWSLMSGVPMAPFSAERQAQLKADPSVRTLMAALKPADKAALSAAVQVMQTLRAQTLHKRHMLELFEANDRMKLGDLGMALPLFAGVLRKNPALAGAYKDLGDVLFASFDMPRAWRSWDARRRLAPGLDLFDAVNQLEQRLLRDHPEYF